MLRTYLSEVTERVIFARKRGVFTRKQGLDSETNKQLLKHIRESGSDGAPLKDLCQVFKFMFQ